MTSVTHPQQLRPDPQFRVSAVNYLVLSEPRSVSSYFISMLQNLGFNCKFELLNPYIDNTYPAALYYFRHLQHPPWPRPYLLTPEESARGLNAIFAHRLFSPTQSGFFGFKLFPLHFGDGSFLHLLNASGVVGDAPLKVIYLHRPRHFMRALSSYEAEASKTWMYTSSKIPHGALLDFSDQLIADIGRDALQGCLRTAYYQHELQEGARTGLVKYLYVSSEDIEESSPNFAPTLRAVQDFLLEGAPAAALRRLNLNSFKQRDTLRHVKARSSLSLSERIPDLDTVVTKLKLSLFRHSAEWPYLPFLSPCRKALLTEYSELN